jgi:hypothetical protein
MAQGCDSDQFIQGRHGFVTAFCLRMPAAGEVFRSICGVNEMMTTEACFAPDSWLDTSAKPLLPYGFALTELFFEATVFC